MTEQKQRALISVYDKSNIVELAAFLHELNIEIVASGNTATLLKNNSIPVIEVSELTGFPEILDGRVKTLHPHIHAAILAKQNLNSHTQTLKDHHISPFHFVIANLYPFALTRNDKNASSDAIIDMIDIGGPTMIRAAAKNYASVTVLTRIQDYQSLKDELSLHQGSTSKTFRHTMARHAFAHTYLYDHAIHAFFSQEENSPLSPLPPLSLHAHHVTSLHYGENPHQKASLYAYDPTVPGPLNALIIKEGRPLSYNNYIDANAAFNLAHLFSEPTIAFIKHTVPCGFASHNNPDTALALALASDPISAFGGIVASNRTFSHAMSKTLQDTFIEVIIAPDFCPLAIENLSSRPHIRLLSTHHLSPSHTPLSFRHINGGILSQDTNLTFPSQKDMQVMTPLSPSPSQWDDLVIACKLTSSAPSNTIVIVNNKQLIGLGSGQTSRVKACELALGQAHTFNPSQLPKAVAASDGFFPFFDGIHTLANAGVKTIAHPGGSKNDTAIIKKASEHNISLVQHGIRSFSH